MYHVTRSPSLSKVRLAKLRPTQFSVGYAEVALKTEQWAKLGRKQRKIAIEHHVFPSVLGPGGDHFIIDHHHLGIALIDEGVQEVLVTTLDDLSWLEYPVFWRTLEFRTWSHPYDHRGRRRDYRDMPRRLSQLEDDPFRSLAGLVRDAGGFAKEQAPFVEFLWADFFRPRVSPRLISADPRRATREGVRLARSGEARYLPGWSGKSAKGAKQQ